MPPRQQRLGVPCLGIEVDSGLYRAGVVPGEPALALARELQQLPALQLWGVFTHAGHEYAAPTPAAVAVVGRSYGEQIVATAQLLRAAGVAVPNVSAGSTPTALHAAHLPGVTEIRPGNYVFYDAMQIGLGTATAADCALRVIVTVTSRPAPDRAVVDCGSKTLAMDRGAHGTGVLQGHGWFWAPARAAWSGCRRNTACCASSPTIRCASATDLKSDQIMPVWWRIRRTL